MPMVVANAIHVHVDAAQKLIIIIKLTITQKWNSIPSEILSMRTYNHCAHQDQPRICTATTVAAGGFHTKLVRAHFLPGAWTRHRATTAGC